jgi:hypothetical protein
VKGPSSRGLMTVAAIGLLGTCLPGAAASPTPVWGSADDGHRVLFTIASPLITESSSLAVSTAHPGLVYTTNDSGDTATVYVLDASDGRLVGKTTLTGVTPVDIEALGIDRGSLVVGDIGDNDQARDSVVAYRLSQPGRGTATVQPDSVTLTYSDGARDAESLLYDGRTERVFVVSKGLAGARVYRSPPDVFGRVRATLTRDASAPAIATDATFVGGHRYAVIRTYFSAVVYRFPSWQKVDSFDLPPQEQGESVTSPGGDEVLWIGSEMEDSEVLEVSLPDLEPPAAPPTASGNGSGETTTKIVRTDGAGSRELRTWAVRATQVAGAGLVVVALVAVVLYRRHRRVG